MQYKRVLLWLIALNVVALICFTALHAWKVHQQKAEQERVDVFAAAGESETHTLAADDAIRVFHLSHSITKTGRISDQDLDWLLALLNTSNTKHSNLVHAHIFGTLQQLQIIPVEQEGKIYDATASVLAHDTDNKYNLNKIFSAKMFGTLKDKRAVPLLLPMLNNPDEVVQRNARQALAKIGFHASPS